MAGIVHIVVFWVVTFNGLVHGHQCFDTGCSSSTLISTWTTWCHGEGGGILKAKQCFVASH